MQTHQIVVWIQLLIHGLSLVGLDQIQSGFSPDQNLFQTQFDSSLEMMHNKSQCLSAVQSWLGSSLGLVQLWLTSNLDLIQTRFGPCVFLFSNLFLSLFTKGWKRTITYGYTQNNGTIYIILYKHGKNVSVSKTVLVYKVNKNVPGKHHAADSAGIPSAIMSLSITHLAICRSAWVINIISVSTNKIIRIQAAITPKKSTRNAWLLHHRPINSN